MERAIWTLGLILLATSAHPGTFRDNFDDGNLDNWNVWKGADQSGQWFVKDSDSLRVCV